jgi:sarcosine oxidase
MSDVIVIGAGAFGGWTALNLLRKGMKVTLIDAWGPGNSRSSSGGDTRVIRAGYNGDPDYIEWVARSFPLWKEAEEQWKTKIYHKIGCLWMFTGDDSFCSNSIAPMKDNGLDMQTLSVHEASERFPLLNFKDIKSVYYEPEAGYLFAKRSCALVFQTFVSEGGEYKQGFVEPGEIESGLMKNILLNNGSKLSADVFVFACGPWLGKLFPDVAGEMITSSRQEAYFFGAPAGDRRYNDMPVWMSVGKRILYGIPCNDQRAFKVCDDARGDIFDPTNGSRVITSKLVEIVREEMKTRFPSLANAPLVDAQVCQYENTPDKELIIDQHPNASNAWIVGGGSGHGFKFSPALGEYVSELVTGKKQSKARFHLKRKPLSKVSPFLSQII